MKKLIFLLIFCLCVNGLTGVSFAGLQSAGAETSSAKASEEKAQKRSDKKKEKDSKSKKSDEKAKKEKKAKEEEKSKKASENSEKKEREAKAKTGKEKRYELDLAKNDTVLLSTILEAVKMKIKLEEVKAIEYENKKDKKIITWKPDEENEKDYIFTVLKNFKTVELRIVTKKDSKLLVLLNGAKAKSTNAKKEQDNSRQENSEETVAAEAAIPAEDMEEEPAGETAENDQATPEQSPVEGAQETPAEADPASAEPSEDDGSDADIENTENEEKPTESEIDGDSLAAMTTATAEDGMDDTEDSVVFEAAEGDRAPNESEGEVSEVQNAPTESQDTPAEGQGEPTDTQGEAKNTQGEPTEGEGAPTEDQGAPSEGEGTPTDDQGTPTEGEGAPNEGDGAPTEDQGAPTDDQGTPTEGDGAPAEDQGEPGAGNADDDSIPDAPSSPEETGEGGATIPAEAEAWFKRNGDLFWGTLEQVVANLTGGETVYIQSTEFMTVPEAPLQVMSTVTLLPDGSVFQGNFIVNISTDDPTIVPQPVLLQPAQLAGMGEKADLFFWVGEAPSQSPEEPEEETEKPVLTVTATGLAESGWSTTQPQFTLSGIPEGKNWSYAAVIYDERIVPIAGNAYAPDAEGVYTLRFAMLDELGDIMSASDQYSIQLDWTAPEVSIEADEETSYTLNVSATDNCSGVDAVTVDGGKNWLPMEDGSYTVTKDEETTFEAGDIMVRDVAGNVFKSEEDYTVEEVEGDEEEGEEEGEEGGGGGGGGGGGSGDGKAALPHASGDGEEGSEYDALTLDLPDEPMVQLTVGGERMALTLKLASAQEPDAPVGVNQPFSARLRHWDDAADDDALNTLVLNAENDADLGDVFTYEWRFNGEVYRMLANSGIKYVALQVGDTVAAFPTVGFTGGTKYTELKMQGVSTRRFDYTLTMKMNLNPSHVSAMSESDHSQECDLSIHAEVEDKNYELSNSPQSLMYYYNVFVGPEDMMDQPFGEYDENA